MTILPARWSLKWKSEESSEKCEILKKIAENGKKYFYHGELPEKIVRYLDKFDGIITEDDFRNHKSQWVDPISINYKGFDVWECPPNGQGIAALIGLNIFENFQEARDNQ